MWIRKSYTEVQSEKRSRLLRATCFDILLGGGLWYLLVRLLAFCGILPAHSISLYIGCAVVAFILPAAWFANRKGYGKRAATLVCDRCNALKTADNQTTCYCGGTYIPLPEMKWVNSKLSGRTFPMKDNLPTDVPSVSA